MVRHEAAGLRMAAIASSAITEVRRRSAAAQETALRCRARGTAELTNNAIHRNHEDGDEHTHDFIDHDRADPALQILLTAA
jgi:hypothetical protein